MSALTTTTGTRGKRRGWRVLLGAAALAAVFAGFGATPSASAHDNDGRHDGWNHGGGNHGGWNHGGWDRGGWHDRGWGNDWHRHWWNGRWVYDGGYGYYGPPRVVYAPPRVVYPAPVYPGYYAPGLGVTFSVR